MYILKECCQNTIWVAIPIMEFLLALFDWTFDPALLKNQPSISNRDLVNVPVFHLSII
jgi:hypothetical protein